MQLQTTETRPNNSAISAKEVRSQLVIDAYMTTAKALVAGTFNRETATDALKPFQDILHVGIREKGHAERIEATVQANLDSALESLAEETKETKGKAA